MSAAPAAAVVTIGQLAPATPSAGCTDLDVLQPTVTSGNAYVVPATVATGTITSWGHSAAPGPGQMLGMKVFRKVGEPLTYSVVAHDGPRPLVAGAVNSFPASIPVKPGDVLGLNSPPAPAPATACAFSVPGEMIAFRSFDLADGASGMFAPAGGRLNATAVVEPSNTFTLGKPKLNKKKGTATLTATVPNPGKLKASGKGVKAASAGGAVSSKTVGAPGPVKLVIKAKGKQAKKLKRKGKVKLKAKITYTPTGGAVATQSRKLKLKRKRKKR